MTRDELLAILRDTHGEDWEAAHGAHDAALLAYIDDDAVTEAFKSGLKWYA